MPATDPETKPSTKVVRQPCVAGQFYPARPEALREEVVKHLAPAAGESVSLVPAIACVVPHAGYIYSGHVAGAVFRDLDLPETFIILCPNHTGQGEPLAIMSHGAWQTPLGAAVIDEELATALRQAMPWITEDSEAHRREHSLEVELPFLQHLKEHFTFVPVCVGTHRLEVLEALGAAIAKVVSAWPKPVMLIASSDMNHYETDSITREKDGKAIEQLLAREPKELMEVVARNQISMCGIAPVTATLFAANLLGATKATLVRYATSADVSGDRSHCVGYAGVIIQ
jgi:MEMO1 family protein